MIATIIIAVIAIVAVIVAIVLVSGGNSGDSSTPSDSVVSDNSTPFQPTEELIEECSYAAHDLVAANYRIVRLFITEGLPHEPEPYNNIPEDGLYTVSDSSYTKLEQIEGFVKSVFIEEEAQRVLTDLDGNGFTLYRNREKLVKSEQETDSTNEAGGSIKYDTKYVLGIDANFTPAADYKKDWSSCKIILAPKSETECALTVYLDGLDENTATEANADSILSISMIKENEIWKLNKFVY